MIKDTAVPSHWLPRSAFLRLMFSGIRDLGLDHIITVKFGADFSSMTRLQDGRGLQVGRGGPGG